MFHYNLRKSAIQSEEIIFISRQGGDTRIP